MNVKPGYQTTEFWISLLPIVGFVVDSIQSRASQNGPLFAILAGVSACVYTISRTLAKQKAGGPTNDDLKALVSRALAGAGGAGAGGNGVCHDPPAGGA